MHQFDFCGAPDPTGGTLHLQRSPDLLAVFKRPTSKGMKGKERERERESMGREGRRRLAPVGESGSASARSGSQHMCEPNINQKCAI